MANYMPQYVLDLSVARFIRFGGNRRMEFRVDAFNAFNTMTITGREHARCRCAAWPIRRRPTCRAMRPAP